MEKHPQSYHILLLKHTSMFYTRKCKDAVVEHTDGYG